jgi:hypothetical protein
LALCLSAYLKPPKVQTLKSIGVFWEEDLQLRRRHRWISGDRSIYSGTLPGRGSAPRAIFIGLHRRHRRLHRPYRHISNIMLLPCFIFVISGATLYHDVKVTVCALCVSFWLVSLWLLVFVGTI